GRAAAPLLAAALALSLTACGYRFARGPSELLPAGTRLAIPIVENPTIEVGYETDVTAALRREFAAIDGVRIADSDDADVVMRAGIVEITSNAASFDKDFVESERQIRVKMAASLVRRGEVVWRAPEILADEYYYSTAESAATRDNRREALARAARTLARQIYLRVQGGWS
ncbi:MAG: hypothetical protein KC466_21470, partial [Myxococcales bacterium]|nr:hypothetical protein [Myxococcales bacterium]